VVSSILGTSQSLVGSRQDCTAGGEALVINTFPKFPILHQRCGRALSCKMDTGGEHGGLFYGESFDAKHAETCCSRPLLQWTPEALCIFQTINFFIYFLPSSNSHLNNLPHNCQSPAVSSLDTKIAITKIKTNKIHSF
jgi:hypothetical protein